MPHGRRVINEEDFLKAYDEHSDAVFRHCYLQVGDRELSKTLMSECFKNLWLFVSRGNQVDAVKMYLLREINCLIKQRNITMTTSSDLQVPAFFKNLSPERRTVYLLHYVDGFSSGDIVTIVGGTEESHEHAIRDMRDSFFSLSSHV